MTKQLNVINIKGVEYAHAPNPKMYSEAWEKDYPPITAKTPWLRNKYTGDIVPNTPEFARRSDILEPFYGELPLEGDFDTVVTAVGAITNAETQPTPDGELGEL